MREMLYEFNPTYAFIKYFLPKPFHNSPHDSQKFKELSGKIKIIYMTSTIKEIIEENPDYFAREIDMEKAAEKIAGSLMKKIENAEAELTQK